VIESTRPLNAAIDRLPADVFTAFGPIGARSRLALILAPA
jgi:hypothetical protein